MISTSDILFLTMILDLVKNNKLKWYGVGCEYMLSPKGCYPGMSVRKGLLQ